MGAGYIERSGEQYLIRAPGQVTELEDIRQIVVGSHDGTPIYLSTVADVLLGKELRTGAATEDGKEVVLGTVFMLMGENSRVVSRRVEAKMEEVNRTLPPGVVAKTVYDRTKLVETRDSSSRRARERASASSARARVIATPARCAAVCSSCHSDGSGARRSR